MNENKVERTAIDDNNLRVLRSSVYDYTSYNGVTMPKRDHSYFNRTEMLKPFDNISDKVNFITNCLKLYWTDMQYISGHLGFIMRESLLGQAVFLIAKNNAKYDGFKVSFDIDEKEIPVVFGDLMRVYSTAGYDVSLLKEFLVELYEEYYPKKKT